VDFVLSRSSLPSGFPRRMMDHVDGRPIRHRHPREGDGSQHPSAHHWTGALGSALARSSTENPTGDSPRKRANEDAEADGSGETFPLPTSVWLLVWYHISGDGEGSITELL
jgi:hypothetical protein